MLGDHKGMLGDHKGSPLLCHEAPEKGVQSRGTESGGLVTYPLWSPSPPLRTPFGEWVMSWSIYRSILLFQLPLPQHIPHHLIPSSQHILPRYIRHPLPMSFFNHLE